MATSFRQNIPGNFGDAGTGLTPSGSSVPNPGTAFGGAAVPQNPDLTSILWSLAGRIGPNVATLAALAAFGAGPSPSNAQDRADGMVQLVEADGSLWWWSAASTAAASSTVIVTTDAPAQGRYLKVGSGTSGAGVPAPGGTVDLKLPVGFGTANGAILYTVPTGVKLLVTRAFWEVTTPFTGGASSTIGIDSSDANYSTPGDILGGAAGDAAANLTAGYKGGTLGTKYGSNGVIVLVAGDTVLFNRITSAFTAGAGFMHLECTILN